MYEPQEDSYLLEKEVKKITFGKVLEIGTGLGILANAAKEKAKSIVAVDIDKKSIEYCKKTYTGIKFLESDLFRNVEGKFDTIIFNPPYLPQDKGIEDIALYGGKKGYEVVERFLNDAGEFLNRDGIILLLFSTLTNKNKVEEIIETNLFNFEKQSSQKAFFEEMFVYKITKKGIRKKIESCGVSSIEFFNHGRRGLIFTGNYEGKKVAIKIKNPKSGAVARIGIESDFLSKVNKNGIGPELIIKGNGFLIRDFVEGKPLIHYIELNKIKKKWIDELDRQIAILDKMKIQKEEMMRPFTNVIISKEMPVLIDFERCKYSENPKNMRQFNEFKKRYKKNFK